MAVECLKDAKAVLSLAHPKEIEKESNIQIESIVEELLNLGIDAIEVVMMKMMQKGFNR